MLAVLRIRDYRLLWLGQAASFLGDQFHMIALPWLVLQLTGDPVRLGIVLALAGLPRAALMLVGGAWADKYSPRTIMLASDAVRFFLAGFLAVSVLGGFIEMWMIYLLAASFGVVSGFFMPAVTTSVPRLLPDEHLERGNALLQGVHQLAQFAGPAAAGILIALFSGGTTGGEQVASATGIGIAFVVDSLTFALSAFTLWLLDRLPAGMEAGDRGTASAVAEALRFTWRRPTFRWVFLLVALSNLLVAGPVMVGVPVLADTRLAEGAAALGLILSASGLGNVVGLVLGGTLPRPRARVLGSVVVGLYLVFGCALAALAYITSTWMALPLMALVGVGNGYLAVVVLSLLQRMAPQDMLGRIMSLMMFFMVGLTPLSMAVSGAIVRLDDEALFVGAGICLGLLALLAASRKEVWNLGAECGQAVPDAPTARTTPQGEMRRLKPAPAGSSR